MSTIKFVHLNCAQCQTLFDVRISDYKRRVWKLPTSSNFYCTRKCGGLWRSENVVRPANKNPTYLRDYRLAHGLTNQKHDANYVWYANRIASEHRNHAKTTMSRPDIIVMLNKLWQCQQGKCAISEVPLVLRVGVKGQCKEVDPFKIASVDRIDCGLPYGPDNIQWVSMGLNIARNSLSLQLFKQYLINFIETAALDLTV